jgi:hypothetical protein
MNKNELTDVTPWRQMHGLVPKPENGVNAMNEVAKEQPGNDGHGGDATRANVPRENQDEQSD